MTNLERTPLKIAIVVHDLKGGGAEKMMVRLANALAAGGDQVQIVLLTEGGVNKNLVDPAVEVIELKATRTMLSIPRLRAFLKQSNPDKILSALTHVNVIATVVCFSLGLLKRLWVSERNAFSLDKHVNPDTTVRIAYLVAPWLYRWQPNPVIAVSKGVASDLVSETAVKPNDVVTAPNPVLANDFDRIVFDNPIHPWLIQSEIPVLVAVGRLENQKGFDILIDAFAELSKRINCRLIIFGEGALREQLEKQAQVLGLEECISIPGYASNILNEMAAADLFILSSRFEGSPNVLVEAMSTGTPVVAVDCPYGPDEILDGGRVAPLVMLENSNVLADTIYDVLQQPDNSRSMRIERARRYTSKNSAEGYRSILTATPSYMVAGGGCNGN